MKRKKRYAKPFDALIEEVSVGLGFCGSVVDGKHVHVTDFIPHGGTVTAAQFADWVLQAEGMDASIYKQHRKSLSAGFMRHMRSEAVDAKLLR